MTMKYIPLILNVVKLVINITIYLVSKLKKAHAPNKTPKVGIIK